MGALRTHRWAKEGRVGLPFKDWRKHLLEKLKLSRLDSWTEENKGLNLQAEYHNIFALEDGEMGCTKAAEHKIKVTDPKPFKERSQNIPTGLLDEVKEHLDHMLEVGAIKPSKLVWSNTIVLVWKKDRGLGFCIDFCQLEFLNSQGCFSVTSNTKCYQRFEWKQVLHHCGPPIRLLADTHGGILEAIHCFHHGHAGILPV